MRVSLNKSKGPSGSQKRVTYIERSRLSPCEVLTSVYPLKRAKAHKGPQGRRLKGSGHGYRDTYREVYTGPEEDKPEVDCTAGYKRIVDGGTVRWVREA